MPDPKLRRGPHGILQLARRKHRLLWPLGPLSAARTWAEQKLSHPANRGRTCFICCSSFIQTVNRFAWRRAEERRSRRNFGVRVERPSPAWSTSSQKFADYIVAYLCASVYGGYTCADMYAYKFSRLVSMNDDDCSRASGSSSGWNHLPTTET